MAPTVGAVWLNVLPSMQAFPSTLTKQATASARVAGARAGQAMGEEVAEQAGATASRRIGVQSQRMAATFTKSTNVMTRGLSNFRAGFADADAAASAFTGRMGRLGGVTRQAVTPGVNAVGRFAGGFRDAQVAASAFSGRLGTVGGVAGRALAPGVQALARFREGFSSAQMAASVFSGRMGSLGGVARTALQPGINAARTMAPAMGAAGAAATSAFGRIRSGASNAFTRARSGFTTMVANARESQEGVGALGGALSSMGAVGAAAVASVGLGALGLSAVRTAANIQQTTASMAGLYGETAAAEDMMRRMREYARNTPLETESLYTAGKNLAYLGLQGDQAMGVIRNVGTALMASGNTSREAMGNVTNALLTMQSSGQLYAADIQRVSNEMVPAWDLLSAHMGMSIKEVRKEVTEGNLTVDDFVAALQAGDGDYFAMMRKSADETSKTFSAQFAQVKDNVNIAIAETLLPLLDRAAPMLGRLGGAVDSGLRSMPGILSRTGDALRSTGLVSGFMSMVRGVREFASAALPALRGFGAVVGTALVGALQVMRPLGGLLQSMAGWMRENQAVVQVLGAALGGAVVAMVAIRTATMLWAGAQAILNAALAANPIGLIVIAVAALVAGVIYAYKNFEGFRNVVNAVGGAIKTAALWIWDKGLKPAFTALMFGIDWVREHLWVLFGAGPLGIIVFFAVTIYRHFDKIKSAFAAVGSAAVWLWNNALKPAWQGIKVGLRALGAVFRWLYANVVKPVFALIRKVIAVWWSGAKAIFGLVRTYILGPLGKVFRWLYRNVVQPVFRGIRLVIAVWWRGAKAIFGLVRKYIIGTLAKVFRWLWHNVIKPVWNGIKATINSVWRNGIKPAFDKVKEGVRLMRKAFNNGRDAIAKAWKGIRNAAKKPVNFLIKTVYNDGIRDMWNRIAGIVDGPKLKKAKGFRTGGKVWGQGTETSDSIPALLSRNEHVWTASEVRGAGGHDAVEALRAQARSSGAAYAQGGPVFPAAPRIPSGRDLLDAVESVLSPKGLFSLGGDIISGDYQGAIDKVLKPARRLTAQIGTEGLPGVPHQVVKVGGKKIKAKLTSLIEAWNASFGGGGGSAAWVGLASASERLRRAAKWVDTQVGKPYQWGGGGNPSWDCSGFMAGIENVIRGIPPGRRYTTMDFRGSSAPTGWKQGLRSPFEVGVMNGSSARGSHMAGTLLGVNVEASGSGGVHKGPSARGSRSSYFTHQYGFAPVAGDTRPRGEGPGAASLFDGGGYVQPGVSLVANRSGRPEPVLTDSQWRDMHHLAETVGSDGTALMGDATFNLINSEATVQQAFRRVDIELRKRRRGGVRAGR